MPNFVSEIAEPEGFQGALRPPRAHAASATLAHLTSLVMQMVDPSQNDSAPRPRPPEESRWVKVAANLGVVLVLLALVGVLASSF